jgi:uncharacterized protein YndB with AHSA1/START domain
MTSKTEFSTPSENAIKFVRRFSADRDTVWAMWTQAERLRNWWGPKGFTTPVFEVDFREGGAWFYCMQDPEGQRYCGKMIYGEIDPPRRFTAADIFADEEGKPISDLPEARSEFEFVENNGETVVTNISRYSTQAARDQVIDMGVEAGLSQCFDRLDQYLASIAE